MINDNYQLRYLPLFFDDVNSVTSYIKNELLNSKAANDLVDHAIIDDAWRWWTMSDREEKFEKMLNDVLDEYGNTVEKMEKLKAQNKSNTVTYKQLMATKLSLQNLISKYEIYGLIEK